MFYEKIHPQSCGRTKKKYLACEIKYIMPELIPSPKLFPQDDIVIEEFFGLISSGQKDVSFCRIRCEAGWSEPPQRPEFDEYMIVLSGTLSIAGKNGVTVVRAGQAAKAAKGERVQYSTPSEACDYISLCVPAFDIEWTHREKI